MAFGVPPMLIGIQGDATYSNYQEAHLAFYRLTVLPLATRVAASLADWLGAQIGEVVELKPDLASECESQWCRVSDAVFLTQAEKRSLLGLPAVVEGSGDD